VTHVFVLKIDWFRTIACQELGRNRIRQAKEMIVVVGLAFEARIAARCGLPIICSGDGRNLTASLKQGIARGATGLISFGVAGGLAPHLAPGTCIVASAVVADNLRLLTDYAWSQRLLDTMPGAVHGILAGAPRPVRTPAEKRALSRGTGALAVDTESHVVAQTAAAFGLPMAAIRVIADPAHRGLPDAAMVAIRPNGTTDVMAVLRSLVRRPSQMSALVRTALDARAARATLLRGRHLLGHNLGTVVRPFPATRRDASLELGELSPEGVTTDLRSALG
jgi:hopanoid-associated phosphorylase